MAGIVENKKDKTNVLSHPYHFQTSPITGEDELVMIEMKYPPMNLNNPTTVFVKARMGKSWLGFTGVGYHIGKQIANSPQSNVYILTEERLLGEIDRSRDAFWISKLKNAATTSHHFTKIENKIIKQMHYDANPTNEDELAVAYAHAPPDVMRHLAVMDKHFVGASIEASAGAIQDLFPEQPQDSSGSKVFFIPDKENVLPVFKFMTGPNSGSTNLRKFFFIHSVRFHSFLFFYLHVVSIFNLFFLLDKYVEEKFQTKWTAETEDWTMWFAEVELVADHMAEGLYTLHTGLDGVYVPFVHQDIKATNVLLTLNDEGNIKKATIGNFEHVRTNSQDIVPAATDMYAMGVTLLQMMLGPVFQRMDKLKIFEGSHGGHTTKHKSVLSK